MKEQCDRVDWNLTAIWQQEDFDRAEQKCQTFHKEEMLTADENINIDFISVQREEKQQRAEEGQSRNRTANARKRKDTQNQEVIKQWKKSTKIKMMNGQLAKADNVKKALQQKQQSKFISTKNSRANSYQQRKHQQEQQSEVPAGFIGVVKLYRSTKWKTGNQNRKKQDLGDPERTQTHRENLKKKVKELRETSMKNWESLTRNWSGKKRCTETWGKQRHQGLTRWS